MQNVARFNEYNLKTLQQMLKRDFNSQMKKTENG